MATIVQLFRTNYPPGTPQHVVAHGLRNIQRGRSPSLRYVTSAGTYYNRSAFYIAVRELAETTPATYTTYSDYLRSMFLCITALDEAFITVFEPNGNGTTLLTREELLMWIVLSERVK